MDHVYVGTRVGRARRKISKVHNQLNLNHRGGRPAADTQKKKPTQGEMQKELHTKKLKIIPPSPRPVSRGGFFFVLS